MEGFESARIFCVYINLISFSLSLSLSRSLSLVKFRDQKRAIMAAIVVKEAKSVFETGKFEVTAITVKSDIFSSSKPLLIFTPTNPGSYPLILFLHGFSCAGSFYSHLLRLIASHGYVIAAPQVNPLITIYYTILYTYKLLNQNSNSTLLHGSHVIILAFNLISNSLPIFIRLSFSSNFTINILFYNLGS